jgi:hypothetical protein
MIATPIQIGPTGPAGANGSSGATGSTGPAGVVAATAPLTYNAGTQTIAIVPASNGSAGSMSAANFAKLDGLPSSIAVDTLAEVLAASDNAGGLPIYNVGVLAAGTVLATLINIEGGSLTLGSGVVLVGDGDNGVGFGGANLTGVGTLAAASANVSGGLISSGAGSGSFVSGAGAISASASGVAIGTAALVNDSGDGRIGGVAVGAGSSAVGCAVAVGYQATAGDIGVAIGGNSTAELGVAVGQGLRQTGLGGVVIGQSTVGGSTSVAIGYGTSAAAGAIAIGAFCTAPSNTMAFGTDGAIALPSEVVFNTTYYYTQATTLSAQITSSSTRRSGASMIGEWVNSTDATRMSRNRLVAYDYNGQREGFRVEGDGSQPLIAFYGSEAVPQPSLTYSRSTETTAAAQIRAALVALGLVADNTTA